MQVAISKYEVEAARRFARKIKKHVEKLAPVALRKFNLAVYELLFKQSHNNFTQQDLDCGLVLLDPLPAPLTPAAGNLLFSHLQGAADDLDSNLMQDVKEVSPLVCFLIVFSVLERVLVVHSFGI